MVVRGSADFSVYYIQSIIEDTSISREPYRGIDPEVIKEWITPFENEIHQLNAWLDRLDSTVRIRSSPKEVSLHLKAPEQSHHRKMIYEYLNTQYPYLQTELVKIDDVNYKLKVFCDESYVDLWGILHVQDIKELYQFKKQQNQELSEKGIIIGNLQALFSICWLTLELGENLSKSDRSKVYNVITKASRMDSKTVDVKGKNTKAMHIFWKSHKKRKISETNSISTSSYDDDVILQSLSIHKKENVYIHFTLMKCNMEQLDAFQRIIHHLSPHYKFHSNDFKYAGIKDKRAITYQRISLLVDRSLYRNKTDYEFHLYNIVKCLLRMNDVYDSDVTMKSICVANFEYNTKPLQLGTFMKLSLRCYCDYRLIGQLWGNEFAVILRNVSMLSLVEDSHTEEKMSLASFLDDSLQHIILGGFPNYFGRQRMGVLHENLHRNSDEMPIGPSIGKLLLLKNYKHVIDAIILGEMYLDSSKSESALDSSHANNARRMYLAGSPLQLVLSLFPSTSVRERTILRGLIRYGTGDPQRVIDLLPYSAITLYISAYQSFIWNQVCSYRISKYGMRPLAGDLILEGQDDVRVLTQDDISRVHDDQESITLFRKVTLPMFGSRSVFPQNQVGR